MKLFVFLLFGFVNAQASIVDVAARSPAGTRIYLADDFFVQSVSSIDGFVVADDCRANISKIIQYAPTSGPVEKGPAAQKYAVHFEAVYDRLPPVFQKMFCHMGAIQVEESFFATAYASSMVTPEGKFVGMIGFRKDFLDKPLGLGHWLTWKEQLNYGATAQKSYEINPQFPTVEATIPNVVSDMIYQVVIHEFGHLFDFANAVSRRDGEWYNFGWESGEPKKGNDYFGRDGFCFYNCTTFLVKTDAPRIYRELNENTNFINAYTSNSVFDDFAEASAYYVMAQITGSMLLINTKQGYVYDMLNKFMTAPIYEPKRKFVEKFYTNPNLKYEGSEGILADGQPGKQ